MNSDDYKRLADRIEEYPCPIEFLSKGDRDLIVTALRSAAEPEKAREVVAWQWRYVGHDTWRTPAGGCRLTPKELDGHAPIEQRPLYPAAPASDVLREALELAAGILQDMIQRGFITVGEDHAIGYHIGEGVLPTIASALAQAANQSDGTASAEGRALGPDPCVGKARDIQKNAVGVASGPSDTNSAEGCRSPLPSGEVEPSVRLTYPSADTPSSEVTVDAPPFEFDRYINGTLMAEGVTVERQRDLQSAMRVAAKIAARGSRGEVPVLVLADRPRMKISDILQPFDDINTHDGLCAWADVATAMESARAILDAFKIGRR